ncbi:hypothetical protein [Desulfosarcina cetonica]|uniref:hypothetical protein n=1 Tax=Desulfosarcina cetonica TaxID=90730 RepID=UPI0006D16F18|nr:hypothetical protein [Desulfosarcina cetonica]
MKKSIYCSIVVCLALAFLAVPLATSALAGEPALKMVGNGTIKSALLVDGSKIPLSGRTSIYLEATEKELAEGILSIKGLNLAFFQVPQAALTYDKIADDRTGALGFALDPGKVPNTCVTI